MSDIPIPVHKPSLNTDGTHDYLGPHKSSIDSGYKGVVVKYGRDATLYPEGTDTENPTKQDIPQSLFDTSKR